MATWLFHQSWRPELGDYADPLITGGLMGYDNNKNWYIDQDEIVYYWLVYTGSQDLPPFRRDAYDAPYTFTFRYKPDSPLLVIEQLGQTYIASLSGGSITFNGGSVSTQDPFSILRIDEPGALIFLLLLVMIWTKIR